MKFLTLWIVLLTYISNVQAANINDLDIGDDVYIQGLLSDDLVYVIRIDIRKNRVKVRRSEDGTTEWINPSQLITKKTSIRKDIKRAGVVIGVITCLVNPDVCNDSDNSNSQSNSPQKPESSKGYKFKVTNNCKHSIKLVLRYKNTKNKWDTVGWWGIDGNKYSYLKLKNGSYVTTGNSVFYFYAAAKDDSFYWNGGKHNYSFDGKTFPMLKMVDKNGDSELTLKCQGY